MAERRQLLAVVGEEESTPDLVRFTGIVVLGFEADITFLAVTPRLRQESRAAANLATNLLGEWHLQTAAMERLTRVEEWLVRYRMVLADSDERAIAASPWRPTPDGALERELRGVDGQSFRLRLREGDPADEVVVETKAGGYGMIFLGTPRQWRKIHRVLQFADPPILVVRKWVAEEYCFLVCVDGTPASRRALRLAARIAKVLVAPLEALAVAGRGLSPAQARSVLDRTGTYLERGAVPHRLRLEQGEFEPVLLGCARESTVVTLGASRRSQVWQLLFGTVPFRIAERAPGPVLVVK